MRFILSITLLTLLTTSFGCGQDLAWSTLKRNIRSQYPTVTQISTDSLARWLASEAPRPVLIDARQPEEYAVSHLPSAIRVPPESTTWPMLDTLDAGTPLVVYCSVGYRSSALAERLQEAGYDAVNLEGSIFQWANEGRPIYRNGEVVRTVHPYDAVWGQLLRKDLRAPID